MVALTHVHPDHQGCAAAVCEERGIPLACHADDVDAMEGRRPVAATSHPLAKGFGRLWQGPPHRVDRVLEEGDEVAGFRVIHAPGHAPGEVIYFRESDRVAICGDVIRNISFVTALNKLDEPPPNLTPDPAENRRSIRKLAELNPSLILPGHGPAVTDIAAFRPLRCCSAGLRERGRGYPRLSPNWKGSPDAQAHRQTPVGLDGRRDPRPGRRPRRHRLRGAVDQRRFDPEADDRRRQAEAEDADRLPDQHQQARRRAARQSAPRTPTGPSSTTRPIRATRPWPGPATRPSPRPRAAAPST